MADPELTPRQAAWRRPRLTFRRLTGLDRSGPPPPETLAGSPLRPWTVPNAIGFVRLALLPVFLVLALSSDAGTDALPCVIFAVVAWSDYADGMAARITGQYSRLGVLLDPVVDRLLILSGLIVCWNFELLPRWALAVLIAREAFMLYAGRAALNRGLELRVNWLGRWGVWPVMSALFFGMASVHWLALAMLFLGLVLVLSATGKYVVDGRRQLARRKASSSR